MLLFERAIDKGEASRELCVMAFFPMRLVPNASLLEEYMAIYPYYYFTGFIVANYGDTRQDILLRYGFKNGDCPRF